MYRPAAYLPESGGIHNLMHTVYNACCYCLHKISNNQYCVKRLMLQKLTDLCFTLKDMFDICQFLCYKHFICPSLLLKSLQIQLNTK